MPIEFPMLLGLLENFALLVTVSNFALLSTNMCAILCYLFKMKTIY